MDKQNRVSPKDSAGDLEFYLSSWMPTQNIVHIMRAEKKDEKEIAAFVEKYEESRRKIKKSMKKFADKIEQKYGPLDLSELMSKGLKFAKKHNLSQAEQEAFKAHILRGDSDKPYLPFQELEYTDMSKFLGFSSVSGTILEVKPTDQDALHEVARLYEANRPLHAALKANIVTYRDCAPEAISGRFDRNKHNVNNFIHPIIAALFLPIIKVVEQRMLYSNIGRMVVQRAAMYLRKYSSTMGTDTQEELKRDFELSYDIARDPNSLNNYLSDESPMANLLKRYKIQIELWKNVLKLREGQYYSKGDFGENDAISGLTRVLNSFDWMYFDSPELYHVQDEGTILRKLLATFSLRPTYTQVSSFMNQSALGYANFGAARLTFINTPIINIKLPLNIYGGRNVMPSVRLSSALTQSTFFIENRAIVPKNIVVIHSREIVFFYVNRRFQSVNFSGLDICFKYMSLPGTMSSVTNINETELHFEQEEQIGAGRFQLRSVAVLNKVSNHPFATTGCSSIIVLPAKLSVGRTTQKYLYYNPIAASIQYQPNNTGDFVSNDPITVMDETSMDPTIPGFIETARRCGTVFIYSDEAPLSCVIVN
jgi:hypothetical protein